MKVCLFFVLWLKREPQFHGELAAPNWAEVRTVPARASSARCASGEAGMPGEGVKDSAGKCLVLSS